MCIIEFHFTSAKQVEVILIMPSANSEITTYIAHIHFFIAEEHGKLPDEPY